MITQDDLDTIKGILSKEKITRAELTRVMRLGRLSGELPPPDERDDDGKPYWLAASVREWAEHNALRVRSAGAPPMHYRRASIAPASTRSNGPTSWNPDERTFEARVASEYPVEFVDWETGAVANEVLIASGCEVGDSVP